MLTEAFPILTPDLPHPYQDHTAFAVPKTTTIVAPGPKIVTSNCRRRSSGGRRSGTDTVHPHLSAPVGLSHPDIRPEINRRTSTQRPSAHQTSGGAKARQSTVGP